MRLAAIDIGSNAARLLINEVVENENGQTEFTKLNLLRVPLRLGMDVFKIGEIGPEREQMVIRSMKVFHDRWKSIMWNITELVRQVLCVMLKMASIL